jgi:hypothetical protein
MPLARRRQDENQNRRSVASKKNKVTNRKKSVFLEKNKNESTREPSRAREILKLLWRNFWSE